MPMARMMAAAPKARPNELVFPAKKPVAIGATTAAIWFPKFRIPPTFPVQLRGAIREGIDQPTGAAAARPPREILSQNTAVQAVRAKATPPTAKPRVVPPIRIDLRTRDSGWPRRTRKSTSHPPTRKSVNVANSQGIEVYKTEWRRSILSDREK